MSPVTHQRPCFSCVSPRLMGILASLALALSLLSAGPVLAAKFNRVLDVGDAAPKWKELPGTDGKTHSLAELKEAKAIVLVFLRNNCPIAQKYTDRLNTFATEYAKRGVAVVGINASRRDGEDLAAMQEKAQQKQFAFTYLRDEGQGVARAFGATVTPHLFVLDAERKIAYMGAFDDNANPARVELHYVRDAVDSLLKGEEVDIVESLQQGCELDIAPTVDLTIIDKAGYDAALKARKGQVVLVDFWLTSCLICARQFPHTLDLARKHEEDGLSVISMCLDDTKYDDATGDYETDAKFRERLLKVLKERNALIPNFAHRYVEDVNSCEIYGIESEAFPHYKLYGRDGKLIRTFFEDPLNNISYKLEDIDVAVKAALEAEE